jgi:hypothetical protein
MEDSTATSFSARYRYRFGTAEFDQSRFELRVAGLEIQRKPTVFRNADPQPYLRSVL